ncbi:MAG: Crp/Fnr family transcriptional regulator [Bacteroidota bacterium]
MDLQAYLIELTPIPQAKADLIASYFEEAVIPKGHLLIREGSISKKSYFLEQGIVRCYLYNQEGEEITTRFYSAPDFLNDFHSFFKQQPSEENFEALTDSRVWTIDLKNVQYCFHNIPEFREWGRMMLTMNYVKMHQQMISFHKYDAKQRYLRLLQQRPKVLQHVPLKYIASYLGITKHSLSRIRKEIASKDTAS